MEELIIKPCPSFPDYFADNLGNIYSMKPPRYCGYKPIKPRIMKKQYDKYHNKYRISVRIGKKVFGTNISTLVLDAFLCPRPIGLVALHGKLGSLVDTPENLTWGTQYQNIKDKERDGTKIFGEKHHKVKLKLIDIPIIRNLFLRENKTQVEIAKKYNVHPSTISQIINNRNWKHV